MPKKNALRIFISYSHKDIKYQNELRTHLKTLELTHNIDLWYDGRILAGDDIDREILVQLSKSDIILLLVSNNFLASTYCIETELKKAIERHDAGEAIVVPIILSECEIDEDISFARLSRVPEDGRPIQKYRPQNNGYINALAKIKQMIDAKFVGTRKSSVVEPASPISIDIYQDGKLSPYVINDATWSVIETLQSRMLTFQKIMTEKLVNFIFLYKQDYTKTKKEKKLILSTFRSEKLKTFLLELSTTAREWLFKDVGVRIHFRVLNKSNDKYIGFVSVDGSKAKKSVRADWGKKITPMSTTSGMIYYSSELNAPLIKSKNLSFHDAGKHDDIYVDYVTSALKFKELGTMTPNPLMSLGISIEKDFNKKYAPYLIALVFMKFDIVVENFIVLLCSELKKVDKDFELSTIIWE